MIKKIQVRERKKRKKNWWRRWKGDGEEVERRWRWGEGVREEVKTGR